MTIDEATELIRFETNGSQKTPQNWADLGCGTGTFTLALAGLLPPESTIIAVDRDAGSLKKIPGNYDKVRISKVVSDAFDFLQGSLSFDGILMANALHFIRDQESFLTRLKKGLKPAGRFLIVEYDLRRGTPWVPYPLPPDRAEALTASCGFTGFSLLGRRPSRYGPQYLYAAMVQC